MPGCWAANLNPAGRERLAALSWGAGLGRDLAHPRSGDRGGPIPEPGRQMPGTAEK